MHTWDNRVIILQVMACYMCVYNLTDSKFQSSRYQFHIDPDRGLIDVDLMVFGICVIPWAKTDW